MPQDCQGAQQRLLQEVETSQKDGLDHDLPPIGKGPAAWRFLAEVCIVEGAIWGKRDSLGRPG